MTQICHKIFFRKHGEGLSVYFPAKFVEEFSLKELDYIVPCFEKSKKTEGMPQERELVLRFRRNKDGTIFVDEYEDFEKEE